MTTEAEPGDIVEDDPGTEIVTIQPAELDINLAHGKSLAEKLREIRRTEMVEDVHFGMAFPGANRPSLLKPGAELLARYFSLRVEINLADKTVVVGEGNERSYIDYEYNVEIYSLETGGLITSIDSAGSCNSRENKYSRQDALNIKNTIQKMAQKRAYVAGILIATGASTFFTQDVEVEPAGPPPPPKVALTPQDVHKRLGSKEFCDEHGIEPWDNKKKRIVWGEHLSAMFESVNEDTLQKILRAGTWRDEFLAAGGSDEAIGGYAGTHGAECMLQLTGEAARGLTALKDALAS